MWSRLRLTVRPKSSSYDSLAGPVSLAIAYAASPEAEDASTVRSVAAANASPVSTSHSAGI